MKRNASLMVFVRCMNGFNFHRQTWPEWLSDTFKAIESAKWLKCKERPSLARFKDLIRDTFCAFKSAEVSKWSLKIITNCLIENFCFSLMPTESFL